MAISDQCLSELEALVQSSDPNALVLAEGFIEQFLQAGPANAREAVELLGELQAEFARRVEPSPMRADILDLLGAHVLRLLESDGEA